MTVLDTRVLPSGIVRRRRVHPDGTLYTTMEVPASVLHSFGRANVATAMARWHRGAEGRAASAARKALIEARLDEGVKPTAIAHEVGCSEAYVRQVRAARRV